MSIQSTRTISREAAINRIFRIQVLALGTDYRELEYVTDDSDYDLKRFIDNYAYINLTHIDKWTNKMLEDIMDKPFFRYSMFHNYSIED